MLPPEQCFDLTGQRALVTGAANGIGAAIARALSARGATIIAADRDEAARVVLSTSTQLVTPTDKEERIEELTGDIPELQTVFWVNSDHYAALDVELQAMYERPPSEGGWFRLSDLNDGALKTFLKIALPRSAALSVYDRRILCISQ